MAGVAAALHGAIRALFPVSDYWGTGRVHRRLSISGELITVYAILSLNIEETFSVTGIHSRSTKTVMWRLLNQPKLGVNGGTLCFKVRISRVME